MNTRRHVQENLLLHTCCADCTEHFISCLHSANPDTYVLTVYFDNSNIHPRTEYLARLKAMQMVAERLKLKLIVADWKPREWFERVGDWKKKGATERCKRCWTLRLEKTEEKARELGFRAFSTTMLTSEFMNKGEIEKIGRAVGGKDVRFVDIGDDGMNPCAYEKGRYYRQNYCGCVYSLVARWEEKVSSSKQDFYEEPQ